jgi:hypothetical protein
MARIMHQLLVLVAIWVALVGAVGGDISLPDGAEGQPLAFGHSLLPLFFHNYTQFNHGVWCRDRHAHSNESNK